MRIMQSWKIVLYVRINKCYISNDTETIMIARAKEGEENNIGVKWTGVSDPRSCALYPKLPILSIIRIW